MRIVSFRIKNYKSFRDSGEIDLARDVNFIVGKNNSRKSSVLRSLSGRLDYSPHRSLSAPKIKHEAPEVYLKIELSKAEFETALPTNGTYVIPYPFMWAHEIQHLHASNDSLLSSVYDRIWENGSTLLKCNLIASEAGVATDLSNIYPSIGEWPDDGSRYSFAINKNSLGQINFTNNISGPDNAGSLLSKILHENLYLFGSQRVVSGRGPFKHESRLLPDGSNLPQVLHSLQGNIAKYNRYNRLISSIFPEVKWVSANNDKDGVEIRIWTIDPATERVDLAIPLNESGTGVGQALAIVYSLLSAESPIMLIDEPTSFLHPSAARSLMRIMASLNQDHQYIVSTHSPETISILKPDQVHIVRKSEQESAVEILNGGELNTIEAITGEVGARLSDLFAADEIIWVEGPTEEICFPMIVRAFYPDHRETYSMLALYNTGDLDGRKATAETVWGIYSKLTVPSKLMPRAVAFVLDHEGRSQQKIKDLKKLSKGLVHFTSRRMYENYLIHPKGIADAFSKLPTFAAAPIDATRIDDWLALNGAKPKYFSVKHIPATLSEAWIEEVHAAKLLSDMLSELSGAQESYQKTKHSVEITGAILSIDREHLSELASFISGLAPM